MPRTWKIKLLLIKWEIITFLKFIVNWKFIHFFSQVEYIQTNYHCKLEIYSPSPSSGIYSNQWMINPDANLGLNQNNVRSSLDT